MIRPQVEDNSSPGTYYRLFRDIREWLPKNVVLCSEGATTMDIGGTQMPLENPNSYLNAGSYGTMGVGLGLVVASCVVHPDRPVVHVSGDSAIGFSGMEMETLCRYGMPAKIVVLNNGGIGPGMPEIPDNPMLNMRPNTLIYGARYDKMMEAFGGFGAYVEDTKDVRDALEPADEDAGPRPRQHQAQPGLAAQAASLPLAHLRTGYASKALPRRRGRVFYFQRVPTRGSARPGSGKQRQHKGCPLLLLFSAGNLQQTRRETRRNARFFRPRAGKNSKRFAALVRAAATIRSLSI